MSSGPASLTGREREALRLLSMGHDVKSLAAHLGLSVHTVIGRLRDARRKLGVSSNRQAARLLADLERSDPALSTDRNLGVPDIAASASLPEQVDHRTNLSSRIAWFSGGMLIMSLVIATIIGVAVFHGDAFPSNEALGPVEARRSAATGASSDPSRDASREAARSWLALLDDGHWEESWRAAGGFFQASITGAQWASLIRATRQPLGRPSSRTFLSATRAGSVPGAPAGTYDIIQFRTDFAGKKAAVETITLVRDGEAWKTVGYFIR